MTSSSKRYYDAQYYTPAQRYEPVEEYLSPHEELYYGYDDRGDYFAAPRRSKRKRKKARKSHSVRNFFIAVILLLGCLYAAQHYGGTPLSLIGLDIFGLSSGAASKDNIQNSYSIDLAALDAALPAVSTGYYPTDEEWGYLRQAEEDNPELADKFSLFNRHIDSYSRGAVITLLLSPEKIDYVLQDPLNVGSEGAGSRHIDVKKGSIPLLMQYDSRWGNHIYGSGGMGNTGCGPTCLSMVAAGLTGNGDISPDAVADYAQEGGYYIDGTGTSWSLFTDGAARFGLEGREIPLSEDSLKDAVKDGAVILSVTRGDFTMGGHFIVVSGHSAGGFTVCDPSSIERSGRLWSAEELLSQSAAAWGLKEA